MHVNGSGAAIGLSEAICSIPRMGTVTADTHVEAFSLGTKVFNAIIDSNAEVRPTLTPRPLYFPTRTHGTHAPSPLLPRAYTQHSRRAPLLQFRLRSYQIVGASVSIYMQWNFMQGMSYHELVQAFKSAELYPEHDAGDTLTLHEPALLLRGCISAFVPDRKLPNLKRVGSTRQLLRRVSVHPPRASAAGPPGGPPQVEGRGGRDVELAAPTMLEPGSYPVLEAAVVCHPPHPLPFARATRAVLRLLPLCTWKPPV